MATLESDLAHDKLSGKLGCEVDMKQRDHNRYYVHDAGKIVAMTFISKGSKHTISDNVVSKMAKQLKLGTAGNLVKFVDCKIDKDECMRIIRATVAAEKPR